MSNNHSVKLSREWLLKRIKDCHIYVKSESENGKPRDTELDLSEIMGLVYRNKAVKDKQEKINFEAQSLLAKIIHVLQLYETNEVDILIERHETCSTRKEYLLYILENAQEWFFLEVYPLIFNNISKEHFVTSSKLFAYEMAKEAIPCLDKKGGYETIQQVAYYHVNVMRLIANYGIELDHYIKKRKLKV